MDTTSYYSGLAELYSNPSLAHKPQLYPTLPPTHTHTHTHHHTHISSPMMGVPTHTLYTPCQLPHKPQLYKDFLLPEQDTSSSEESEGDEDNHDMEDKFLDFD